MWATKATNACPVGPNTHDDPHKTEDPCKAAQPLFVEKNHFGKYQKFLNL